MPRRSCVQGLTPRAFVAEFAAYAAARVQGIPGTEVRRGGFVDIRACASDVAPVDLVVAINGSFAYLQTPEERADALAQCREVLRPRGLLVLDLPNLLRILFEYDGAATYERELNGRAVRLERRHRVEYDRALEKEMSQGTLIEPASAHSGPAQDCCFPEHETIFLVAPAEQPRWRA